MMRFLAAILAFIALATVMLPMPAKKVRLSHRTPEKEVHGRRNPDAVRQIDPRILSAERDSIRFAGFDKNASSDVETFFISNNASFHIAWVKVRITYRDMDDRMLHRRDEYINVNIPRNETRMASLKAFDRQNNLYYYKSRPPRSGGMPFRVEIYLLDAGE